jgi:hypothetical protein
MNAVTAVIALTSSSAAGDGGLENAVIAVASPSEGGPKTGVGGRSA